MCTKADRERGLSAMARVTSSTAAIAANLLAKGEIREKGIVAPEEAFKDKAYEVFMNELEEREISVVERILPIRA
jgi:saccharopine dehydrogenase-like NADP-dependent oxidoreductase